MQRHETARGCVLQRHWHSGQALALIGQQETADAVRNDDVERASLAQLINVRL